MSVVTPATPVSPAMDSSSLASPAVSTLESPSKPSPIQAAPTHSILRPCNKAGIPVGPPVIVPPTGTSPPSAPNPTTPTVTSATPVTPTPATAAAPTPAPVPAAAPIVPAAAAAAAAAEPGPSSPSCSARTMSSTDSLNPPSLSTGQSSSPPGSAICTLGSSVSTNGDVFEVGSDISTPRSSMISPSPKIRFGHLPERPPELRRRNSITLGVLARKNMLHAQGTTSAAGGMNKVYMTDAEWEAYQQKFNAQKNTAPAVDLGAVVSSGAKNLWRKVRRGSNASVVSNASMSSQTSTPSARGRSDSAPSSAAPISPRVGPVEVAPVIVEEEEPQSAPASPRLNGLQLTSMDGDRTPGRRASPTPDEAIDDDDEDDRIDVDADADADEAKTPHDSDKDSVHGRDDADVEHYSHRQAHDTAALGFEMRDYKKRPTWGRRGSGSGSALASPVQSAIQI